MVNPRQRRKARSSSYRPVSHSKNAKRNLKKAPPIRGPKALQEAWDKTKTVRQNYARIGLAVSLDPLAAGGLEKAVGVSIGDNEADTSHAETSTANNYDYGSNDAVPSGFGRLIRDDSGKVIGVELNDDEDEDEEMEVEDVDNVDSRIDPAVRQKWVADLSSSSNTSGIGGQDEGVIKELECISAKSTGATTLALPLSNIGARHTSIGEMKYLQPLITKHGDDICAMAKDLRLNPEQRTVGQLRRALRNAGFLMPE